jgi:thioredoxin-dependent peroxiredoxin
MGKRRHDGADNELTTDRGGVMFRHLLWALGTLLAVFIPGIGRLTAEELKPGDKAPDFNLQGSDGKTYSLADFRDKQAVVLAWFPKAFTPGCAAECKSFGTGGDELRKFNVAYFTASRDTAEKNREFAKSLGVDFPILSDPEGRVSRQYGVVDAVRQLPQRWTFYIGKDGKILYIDRQVNTATHAADVAAKLKELGIERKK